MPAEKEAREDFIRFAQREIAIAQTKKRGHTAEYGGGEIPITPQSTVQDLLQRHEDLVCG